MQQIIAHNIKHPKEGNIWQLLSVVALLMSCFNKILIFGYSDNVMYVMQ